MLTPSEPRVHTLDLREVPCPLNLVKAKMAIEGIHIGEILEMRLDEGEPIQNLPASLGRQGHEIIGARRCENHFCVTVRRRL